MTVQFVVVKSVFCCNSKFIEGTIQDITPLPLAVAIFNMGAGVHCEM